MKATTIRLMVVMLVLMATLAGAIWIDATPDAEMEKRWNARAAVSDEQNLYLAMLGVASSSSAPLHVSGRHVWSADEAQASEQITLPPDRKGQFEALRSTCRPIPESADGGRCLDLHAMASRQSPAEKQLAERYRALHAYRAFASLPRDDGVFAAPRHFDAHLAFISSYLTVNQAGTLPLTELRADTLWLREMLAQSDSALARIVLAATLERNYRIAAEIIETGDAAAAAVLAPLLQPLPSKALDFEQVLPYEYASQLSGTRHLKQELFNGKDPLRDVFRAFAQPSPFPASEWQRWIMALRIKPVASANAYLAHARTALEMPGPGGTASLRDKISAAVNFDALESSNPALGADWQGYRSHLLDLDQYVRLVAKVAVLAQQDGMFDPVATVEAWNREPSASGRGRAVLWDDKHFLFSFGPGSKRWQRNAAQAKHDVQVRLPSRFTPLVDEWDGMRAICRSGHCRITKAGLTGQLAWLVSAVPGRYVELVVFRRAANDSFFEQRVRLRARNDAP